MKPSLNDQSGSSPTHIDASLALKTFYLGAATAILLVYNIPPLRDRFLAYGARRAANQAEHRAASKDMKSNGKSPSLPFTYVASPLIAPFDFLATLQVPHSWFTSFYLVSVASSMVWGHQLLTLGPLYSKVANWTHCQPASMSLTRVALSWSLMALQGTRRLLECLLLTKPSQSRMWVFHWLAGILFYVATGISVWVEGIPALDSNWTFSGIRLSGPSLCDVVFLLTFILASILQHRAHIHLASLKKYTLPSHPAFNKIVCPHYTAECVLYLALTVLAAPQGHLVNGTVLCATIFVVVNLGVTADISRKWAVEKFGREKVERKWRMLPGLW